MPRKSPRLAAVNKQVEEVLNAREDRLHNDTKPTSEVLSEAPAHRLMIIFKSQGYSDTEIAQFTGYTKAHIGTVLRQPWARARLLDLLKERRVDPMTELLKASVLDSVHTLIEVRDDTASGSQARIAASNALLDRYLGRPVQRVETEGHHTVDVTTIDRELLELEAQEKVIFGRAELRDPTGIPGSSDGATVRPAALLGEGSDRG